MFATSISTFSRWFLTLSSHAMQLCCEIRSGRRLERARGRQEKNECWTHLDG